MTKPNDTMPVPADTRPVGSLAVPETAGSLLHRINEVEADWDDLDDLDMVPAGDNASSVPFIKTNGNIDGGLTIDGVEVDEVKCVIASRSVSRSKFEKSWDEDKNARPVCWSSNGLTPDDTVAEKQSAKCATCPFSFEIFGPNKKIVNGVMVQPCKKNLEVLAYLPNVGELDIMRFRFGGISVAPANDYWNSFSTKIPKKHPIGFITRVTMRPKPTANGDKLAAHFERGEQLPREGVETLIADARRRKAMWQKMIADDVTSAAAQSTDGGETPSPFDDEPPFAAVDTETGEITYDKTPAITPEAAADLFGGGEVGDDSPF